ncbi:MAG: hypothetical protein ACREUU_10455, partial [Gammaproteobacteria bacterium]
MQTKLKTLARAIGLGTRTPLTASAVLVAVLLGWLTSGHPGVALAQDQTKVDKPANEGTPSVLPRPDFHFPGNVGRTYLDSDKAQFPQPVQAPKGALNIV